MRIAFVSDIHCNLAVLQPVMDDIALRGVNWVVNPENTPSSP